MILLQPQRRSAIAPSAPSAPSLPERAPRPAELGKSGYRARSLAEVKPSFSLASVLLVGRHCLLALGLWGALGLTAHRAHADMRLPKLLSPGAVLQRDQVNRLWGWADDGETIRIEFDGRPIGQVTATAGRWQFALPPQGAGGPHTLRLSGTNEITLPSLVFGDVWVASGQSNMQLPMERVKERYGEAIRAAEFPNIRYFTVPRAYNFQAPQQDVQEGQWQSVDPTSVLPLSAVGFFFARHLHEKLGVPIGIVSSNYGGSTAEGWMSRAALERYPHFLRAIDPYRDAKQLQSIIEEDRARSNRWHQERDRKDPGLSSRPKWFASELDTSAWSTVSVPGLLNEQGVAFEHGTVWLRKTFALPEAAKGRPARLMLGRIVDADTAYVNGTEVGHTTYQYPPRRYTIPAGVLRPGPNTLTVRLTSDRNAGELVTDKPYWLEVGGKRHSLTGQWHYRLGAKMPALAPPAFQQYMQPLGFYNAMLAPLLKTSIRGVIWYQGESNVGRASEYGQLFPDLIQSWRKGFGQGDFPFLFVQLASFLPAKAQPGESAWAEARAAQAQALQLPNTAMAVALDVGEWNDIHPLDKQAVGDRLALAARRLAYHENALVYSGPTLQSLRQRGRRLVLAFKHVGSGLSHSGEALGGFAIAGSDRRFRWAEARIEHGAVVVEHPEVSRPLHVRYGWADNPSAANLLNREGLPAAPFSASAQP